MGGTSTGSAHGPARPRRRFCREALEASVSALIVALLLKAFVVEAYRIPTGSMQPTLYGHEFGDGSAVKDTVLVDRLAYLYGEPRRFDVAVFRFPLDRSRSFVKRIWGLPGDTLRIANGDVQRREDDGSWQPLQRPEEVMGDMWLPLEHHGAWELTHAHVDVSMSDVERAPITLAPPPGALAELVFPRGARADDERARIVDLYRDGYPAALRQRLAESGGRNVVGDLRLAFDVRAPMSGPALRTLTVELYERDERGWRTRRVTLSTAPGSYASVELDEGAPNEGTTGSGSRAVARSIDPTPLVPGRWHHVVVQNLDDVLQLRCDRVRAEAAVEACEPVGSYVRITADGPATLRGLALARDVHYMLGGRAATDTWTIPPGHYFVLGDNTQRSVDSREWRLVAYRYEAGARAGDVVLGQNVPGENPLTSLNEGEQPVWTFRDQWGERHRFPTEEMGMPPPIEAPFVPRDHLVGRVFVALWPFHGGLGRPTWIR